MRAYPNLVGPRPIAAPGASRGRGTIIARERKRRTRWLILIGLVVKRKADENPKTEDLAQPSA